jgi:hypothetical protein
MINRPWGASTERTTGVATPARLQRTKHLASCSNLCLLSLASNSAARYRLERRSLTTTRSPKTLPSAPRESTSTASHSSHGASVQRSPIIIKFPVALGLLPWDMMETLFYRRSSSKPVNRGRREKERLGLGTDTDYEAELNQRTGRQQGTGERNV